MTKGYWVANVVVTDTEKYADYQALASKALTKFGAVFLARGSQSTRLEGGETPQRSIIMAFSSYQQALACYHSEEYQAAKAARQGAAEVDITLIESL